MRKEQQAWSPFAVSSSEPRFALDGKKPDPGLLALALSMHLYARDRGHLVGAQPTFRGHLLDSARLAVAVIDPSFAPALPAGVLLFDAAPAQAAAEAVARWLVDRAAYPAQPWFDGGESRGFQAWHVPFGDASGPYGCLVVEPKWFEVHK